MAIISGCRAVRKNRSGLATRSITVSARAIASIFGDCSPTITWRKVTIVNAIAIEIASATPWPTTPPKTGTSSCAIAGSPRKPMPRDARVIPTWQVATNSSTCSI